MQSKHRSAPAGLSEALDQALARIGEGESIEACLEAFAPYAADLEPLLRVDELLRAEAALPLPPEMERWLHTGAREFQAIAEQMAPRYARRRTRISRQLATRTVAAVLVTAVTFATVDSVSAQSIPGEPLYSWKIAREDLSIQLATDAETRGRLHVNYAQRRLAEMDKLAAMDPEPELIAQTLSSLVAHVQAAVVVASQPEAAEMQPELSKLLVQVEQVLDEVASEAPDASTALDETRDQIESITQSLEEQPAARATTVAGAPTSSATPTRTVRPTATPSVPLATPAVPIIIREPG
ncbi:MAG: DUF5667 domain-containing protein, partial [Chloroflexota bacterium]